MATVARQSLLNQVRTEPLRGPTLAALVLSTWFAGSFKPRSLDDFAALCPPGSDENASYRMVTTYWEMVASFVTSGVLSQELFFQSGRELLLVWERLREILPALREKNKDPFAYANLEAVATAYVEYLDRRAPGTYAAFSARQR